MIYASASTSSFTLLSLALDQSGFFCEIKFNLEKKEKTNIKINNYCKVCVLNEFQQRAVKKLQIKAFPIVFPTK